MKCVLEWGDAFNLKPEGPSFFLYSLDTHNESKKVVSVHRLRLCMKLGLKLYLKKIEFFNLKLIFLYFYMILIC